MKLPVVASVLITLCSVTLCIGGDCPPDSLIGPNCWCLESHSGGALFCNNILNPKDLVTPIEACQNRKVTALGISNSSLQYIPHDVFRGTRFVRISFMYTELMALSNTPRAFEGLENSLEEIRAVQTQYSALWRFRQLRYLKELHLIDINNVMMESLSERLPPFPKLETFGLIKAGINFLDDEVFADCSALKILDLQGNHISILKRSMLPKPATMLQVINLQNNHLESLPNDFFEGMPSLLDVVLSKNRISTLDEKTFQWVYSHVSTLDLSENPLRCDCRIQWVVNQKSPYSLEATCAEPESIRGAKVKYLSHKSLYCHLNR